MTIHELLAAAGLTANDELPIWDSEESGEATRKITATQLANAVKSLASLIGTNDLDAAPTSGSTNAVQSGGVHSAIAQSTAKGFFETYLSNATTFSFTARNGANEGYLIMGCSGTVAPFVYYIGNGSGTAMTVQRIVDPYGLTVTAAKSGSTITITFSVAVTSIIKVLG